MQIVIDIQDDVYKRALVYKDVQLASNSANDLSELITAVANGTVLPENHGRLIDADKVREAYFLVTGNITEVLNSVPTILEADKEASE
jgi:hypothetical protein